MPMHYYNLKSTERRRSPKPSELAGTPFLSSKKQLPPAICSLATTKRYGENPSRNDMSLPTFPGDEHAGSTIETISIAHICIRYRSHALPLHHPPRTQNPTNTHNTTHLSLRWSLHLADNDLSRAPRWTPTRTTFQQRSMQQMMKPIQWKQQRTRTWVTASNGNNHAPLKKVTTNTCTHVCAYVRAPPWSIIKLNSWWVWMDRLIWWSPLLMHLVN